MSIVFVLFAVVQLNDPDPELWVPIYMLAAVNSFLIFKKKIIPILIIISMVGYFAGAVYNFDPIFFTDWLDEELANQTTQMKSVLQEEGREFFGLTICFATMATYMFYSISRNKLAIG